MGHVGKGGSGENQQILAYVKQENISAEEMRVKNNEVNQEMKPRLVDTTGFLEAPWALWREHA